MSYLSRRGTAEIIAAFGSGLLVSALLTFAGIWGYPISILQILPFALLLISIALGPLLAPRFWHHYYPKISLFLGGLALAPYFLVHPEGSTRFLHSLHEYFSFISLIGGLFIVASCIHISVKGRANPFVNTSFLAVGAVLANILGTTGASMLLIRPFIALNKERIQAWHILFFILLVSNVGGLLTPIGDPPLYLGYIKGVPFFWTLKNLWHSWGFMVAGLLAIFLGVDRGLIRQAAKDNQPVAAEPISLKFEGKVGIVSIVLMIAAVFVDPILAQVWQIHSLPLTACLQIGITIICLRLTPRELKRKNHFNFEPLKEVAFIFAGIFAAMLPALEYLAEHAGALGIEKPWQFYAGTGVLSAFLDNAPTYLNFLQLAIGPQAIEPPVVHALLAAPQGNGDLIAISTGAVFFGALTYIGNGPNFMVKNIAESFAIKMPSFFSYLFKAVLVLGPLLILHALLFL